LRRFRQAWICQSGARKRLVWFCPQLGSAIWVPLSRQVWSRHSLCGIRLSLLRQGLYSILWIPLRVLGSTACWNMAEIAKDHSVLKGGEQHAVWTGAGWMGLCALLRLPLRWVPIPGVALGGVAAEAAGDEDGPDMGGRLPMVGPGHLCPRSRRSPCSKMRRDGWRETWIASGRGWKSFENRR